MFEVRLVIDEVDYDKLVDVLLPILADNMESKGGILSFIGRKRRGLKKITKHTLGKLSQKKKDEYLLQLLNEKRELIIDKINEKSENRKLGITLIDIDAKQI